MKEHTILHKTVGAVDQNGIRRGRSGSVKNELSNYVRGPSGEVLSPISQTDEDSSLGKHLSLSSWMAFQSRFMNTLFYYDLFSVTPLNLQNLCV